ncbi:MAG: hypothetical protein ABFD92_18270 [Planctomycetaceae bacterium]|nr:hypothetical protein [Planctomycetaceae bacterium]
MKKSHLIAAIVLAFGLGAAGGMYFEPLRRHVATRLVKPDVRSNEVSLAGLDDSAIRSARERGSVEALLPLCREELLGVLGDDFGRVDEPLLRVMLSTIAAANFAEYGGSSATRYEDIKAASHLNCGNTILLTGYLFGTLESRRLRSIGFDGGYVGNHAQLLYRDDSGEFLLDPTVGLIARTSFDDLLSGRPVPRSKIRVFSIKARSIDAFRERVYTALRQGKYRPCDLMYMHESLAEHVQKSSSDNYFTPGGIFLRQKLNRPLPDR